MAKAIKRKESKVRITVYEIHYVEQNPHAPKLSKDLYQSLNASKTIRDRLMPLTQEENNSDNDFITKFIPSTDFLFGSFARLTTGEESSVPKAVLDQKEVSLNDMISESNKNSEGSIKTSSFFCIYKTLLAVTNKQQTIKPLEVYVNWLLEKDSRGIGRIRFIPKKNTATLVPVQDIKSVQISGDYINAKDETKSKALSLTSQLLKMLLDVKGKKDFDEENLISAILTLKFKQKEIKKEQALDAAFRITDDENIIVTGKDGNRIRGSQYLITAVKNIEKLKNGIFNEQEIETAMRQILKDVKNGKLVS